MDADGQHVRLERALDAPSFSDTPSRSTCEEFAPTRHSGTGNAEAARLKVAVSRLERIDHALSARAGVTWAQRAVLGGILAGLLALGACAPQTATVLLQSLFTLAFSALLAVRLIAIAEALRPQRRVHPLYGPLADEDLPMYTILVALYREAEVVPQLLAALAALDYPADRVDIIFALEAGDSGTFDALQAALQGENKRIVIVPDGSPRTKPRALCYALTFARGDYVVVYDAEDQPEPGQLRAAVAGFASGGECLGCLQARLNVYNSHECWLTRQFAIEYTSLFDAILPAFARYRVPVPLGGTSNHFPRSVLEHAGGWDPYNVTEDADLGVRLARFGYTVAMLHSTTWEEAPPRARDWLNQRRRWHKGWLQTYFVHMRAPARLWRELGAGPFIWFQIVAGGGLLSALVHPWLYAWLAWHTLHGGWPLPPDGTLKALIWWSALAAMIASCLAAVVLAMITVRRRKFASLMLSALATPLYWLPVSLAAYRALWDFVVNPFYWAKTPHRPRQT